MNPYVAKVVPLPDHQLKVTFENGEVKLFDVTQFLDRGEFVRLKNSSLFKTVRVVSGSIEWLGGLDLSYDTLYVLGRAPGMDYGSSNSPETRNVAEPPKTYGPA